MGAVPEMDIALPTRTARENPIVDSNGLPLEIKVRI
jgi:hypothetical protein